MSSRVAISYDGTSLQTSTIVSELFSHESVDTKILDLLSLGRADGAKLVATHFQPKVIRVSGTIKGTSQANLEASIDTLKALLNRSQKNLDIGYAGGTRRYICSSSRFTLERMHYHLTFAEWSAEFIVSNPPFGKSIDTSTFSYTDALTGSYTGAATFAGSARPYPKIKVTVNSQTTMTSLQFRNKNTGDWIRIDRTFANSDVVIIDTFENTVTVNGVAVDYSGIFPDFVQGANDFVIRPIAVACNLTVKLIYYQLYL